MNSVPAASRNNCFDLLRLILAGMVVYSHSYYVGGFGEEPFSRLARSQTIAGSIGVLGFFGLSGFLVSDSFLRKPEWLPFLRRRVLRIMPGYWGCLIVTAFVLAPLMFWVQRGQLRGFPWLGEEGALSYVIRNAWLMVRQWSIADVIAQLPNPGSINGSLWSLALEFLCYLGVLFVGVCGLLSGGRAWLAMCIGMLTLFHVLATSGGSALPLNTLPTLVTLTGHTPFVLAFLVGTACRVFSEYLAFNLPTAIVFGAILLVVLKLGGYQLLSPWLIPLFLINVGHSFTLRLTNDFSYGIYIYGMPCQQLLALSSELRSSPLVFFLASLLLSTAFAAASWFGIERRFLARARVGLGAA